MNKLILCAPFFLFFFAASAQQPVPVKPRILISTDIGGTDPDDNQSMTHLLMYSDRFEIEGLVSSPSYGQGSKQEILRMITLYEQDFPKLQKHAAFPSPESLRSVTKQGRKGNAPFKGYTTATEGSDWIISCARKKADRPLWVLVWGGLEDLAQALHDAPDIQQAIRVYWIGGPNKKWSANSYAYIAANFPNLFFLEVNSSYYGFFSNNKVIDSLTTSTYYDQHIRGAGALGKDFRNYYNGQVKMGDTPSLLYMMDGDPAKPSRESWGGSFERLARIPRVVFDHSTNEYDTVPFCAVVEFQFQGPNNYLPPDSACFWMETVYKGKVQSWPGYHLGNGQYSVRYVPKQAENVSYTFRSNLPGTLLGDGELVVDNLWPGKRTWATDYKPGPNWYTDSTDPAWYDGDIQGGKTVSNSREQVLMDWAKRWDWLR